MFGITPYNKYHGVYDPFRELEKMEKELFSGRDGLASFRTDIKDNGGAYLLEAELPGFKKEDIHVDIANGVLTVSAERKHDEEKKDGKGNIVHSERTYGRFERSFDVSEINEKDISAEYADGVLKLNLPKKTEVVPESRRLEIK